MYITENRVAGYDALLPQISPYFEGFSAAVVDIETTGLSAARDAVFLIGVLTRDEKGLKVTQFLAASREEEPEILAAFFDFIRPFELILSYNGTSFDLPFLNKRSRRHRMQHRIDPCRSVDYLRLFRTSYLPGILPDLKLKTVEKLAGVDREDTISGKDCIAMFRAFSEKNDRLAGKKVLLHNFEDLSCFPALDKLIRKIDLHAALMKTGFPVRSASHGIFFVREIKCSGDAILARGDLPDCAFDLDYYGEDFTLRADSMADRFELDAAMPSADGLPPREINARIREILVSV
ncbi:MAG: ribonuclease H-like domain-containing protein [Firmicutes bacterium]|nr:ribonuclease H-like domain-containing protein [Bacillota bacterium]